MGRQKILSDNGADLSVKKITSKENLLQSPLICIAHYLNVFPTEAEKKQFLGLYLERVLTGEFKLYWHLENRLACKVQKVSVLNRPSLLPYNFSEFSKRLKKKLKEGDVIGQITNWADPQKAYFVADTMDISTETSPYRLYRRVSKTPTGLHGELALEIDDKNLVMTEWVRSLITGFHKDIMSLDGVIVSRDGVSWQLVECINDHPVISIHFPDIKEVYVAENDINLFQKELVDADAQKALLNRERNGYLRTIGAMMALLSSNTRKIYLDKGIIDKKINDMIKRPCYQIEADVIEAIGRMFPSTPGLRKSKMQGMLRDSKKVFGLPDVWPDEE